MTRGRIGALLGGVGALVDRAVVSAALDLSRKPARGDHDPQAQLRQLARVAEAYSDPVYRTEPDRFFTPPDAVTVDERLVRALPRGGRVVDLSFESAFVPVHPHPRDMYLEHAENQRATARAWLHETPRPAMVCIHGYLGGWYPMEETVFEASRWYRRGLDVMFAVLPFHGPRAPQGRAGIFPGRDPWRTVEGFAHAVHDLRAWRRWLHQRGCARVGTLGMSLGGYTAALLATVDPWDFTVLMIPLASLADVYFDHREGRAEEPPAWVRPRIEDAFSVVSPTARPSKVAPHAARVLAATGDRITPRHHATRLQQHFGCELDAFAGGHLLQLGRGPALARTADFLEGLDILSPR